MQLPIHCLNPRHAHEGKALQADKKSVYLNKSHKTKYSEQMFFEALW